MKQKDIFLRSEGDAYFRRAAGHPVPRDSDPLVKELGALGLPSGSKVLEIGCGDGERLQWLAERLGFECFGLDPSGQAVAAANQRGRIQVRQGTADALPFEAGLMDAVVFGTCLYLCDREDLFRIACEADRVLKNPGWLLMYEFYSPVPLQREYRHVEGLYSYKMDYRNLFLWHPGYTCYVQRVMHWSSWDLTDKPEDWTAVSVLRKNLCSHEP